MFVCACVCGRARYLRDRYVTMNRTVGTRIVADNRRRRRGNRRDRSRRGRSPTLRMEADRCLFVTVQAR